MALMNTLFDNFFRLARWPRTGVGKSVRLFLRRGWGRDSLERCSDCAGGHHSLAISALATGACADRRSHLDSVLHLGHGDRRHGLFQVARAGAAEADVAAEDWGCRNHVGSGDWSERAGCARRRRGPRPRRGTTAPGLGDEVNLTPVCVILLSLNLFTPAVLLLSF